ncbi:hypothetical protein CCMA1212_004005 [Trichoderma ghanense]|uniref:Proteophosphoglycan ppg4 n=1 Tax=Trichoderma ghanense TaxID=65468 RepID=A0ABY2H967_9HYPO
MGGATRMFGREPERANHPIGLGWLLAIALCGGILLFTTVGLLLVWWVKKSRSPGPQTVYGYATTETSSVPPTSTSRLIKRRLLGGGGGGGSGSLSKLSSRLSSRFSVLLPGPGQGGAPPRPSSSLPTHESFALPERRRTVSRGRKRSRSWVDEDDLHGPRIARSKRSARDSWFGAAPTLPSVDAGVLLLPEVVEVEEDSSRRVHVGAGVPLQHPQPRWIPRSQTEPGLIPMTAAAAASSAYPVDLPAAVGPVRIPAPQAVHMRPSATDSNLKGILRSTEMRLSDRNSRPPVNVSRSSAVRGSPTKGHRTSLSARSSNGFPLSGSPPKSGGLSNTTSMSSIGSAANSLIAAATQELELPGRSSSPSKAKGVRFEEQLLANGGDLEKPQYKTVLSQSPQTHSPQRQFSQMALIHHPSTQSAQQHPPPQTSPERRMSLDSDKSSSLSTLYSTNEPEEERPVPRLDYDPFVEKGGQGGRWPNWQTRQRLAHNDSQRRAKTLSSASLTRIIMGEPASPPQLRPLSAISQPDMACGGLMSPLMLDSQPASFARDAATDRLAPPQTPYLNQVPSEVSFVSMSVDSDATEVPATEVPRADWHDSSDSASSSPTTPTGQSRFPDMSSSSSPYDEREIMSLLMATAPPQRALPLPPPSMTGTDGAIVAVLSPTPGSRLARRGSNASSVYTFDTFLAEQGTALAPSPSRRSIVHPIIEGPRLSSTIAELRRMNSVLSTYSVASIASTAAEGDSPTLPASLSASGSASGSGLAKSRSVLFGPASIGSRHYLNVGNTRSLASSGSRRFGPRGSRHRRAETCYYGKDSGQGQGLGLGLRLACIVDETVDVDPHRRTQSLVCDPGMEVLEGVAPPKGLLSQKLRPVEELIAAEQRLDTHRASVESLGLYDKDGFLISSPERKSKGLRI